jgi:uncharacterized protein YijF (DUF1287 family)
MPRECSGNKVELFSLPRELAPRVFRKQFATQSVFKNEGVYEMSNIMRWRYGETLAHSGITMDESENVQYAA